MEKFKKFSLLSESETITADSTMPGCISGHTFVYGGSGQIPEGFACLCGQTRMHYEKCECCGFVNGKAVLKSEYEALAHY